MKKFVALVGLLALGGSLGVIVANGGVHTGSSPKSQPVHAQTNPNPVLNLAGSSPAQLAGDGRYFGYLSAASADLPTIRFDVAQFFFGKSVQKAAEEDGAVERGEPVSNDHYERNREAKVETLELGDDVQVTAPPASFLMSYVWRREAHRKCYANGEANSCPLSLTEFVHAVKELDYLPGIPVWVTIRDSVVVRIDEQYFP